MQSQHFIPFSLYTLVWWELIDLGLLDRLPLGYFQISGRLPGEWPSHNVSSIWNHFSSHSKQLDSFLFLFSVHIQNNYHILLIAEVLAFSWFISCYFGWQIICSRDCVMPICIYTLIERFMGPTWGPSGTDRTQVVPMLAPWTLLTGYWWLCISCSNWRSMTFLLNMAPMCMYL